MTPVRATVIIAGERVPFIKFGGCQPAERWSLASALPARFRDRFANQA